MRRGTLTALSILVVLLAVVVLLDRPRRTDEGTGALAQRVVGGFAPTKLERVRLRGPAGETVLGREGDALVLTAPGHWPTDEDAVGELLGAIEYLSARRWLPAVGDAEAKARGFVPVTRQVELGFTGGRRVVLDLGRVEPALGRTWMRTSERPGEVFLVDDYQARALERSAVDFRRREPFRLTLQGPKSLDVRVGARGLALRGRPACVVVGGGCARADEDHRAALVTLLDHLRLTRFLDGGAAESAPGELAAEVVADDQTLRVGGACPGVPEERLVASPLGAGCVRATFLEELEAAVATPLDWVDRALLGIPPDQARRFELKSPTDSLVFERRSNAWTSAASADAADDAAVRAWLQAVAELRATAVEPARADRLDDEVLALVVTGAGVSAPQTVHVYRRGRELLARRDDEPVLLRLPPSAGELLVADPIVFQSRAVLSFDPYTLTTIEFAGQGGAERAERGATATDWELVAPLKLPADPDTVVALRDVAANLEAEQVVAAAPTPAHGLAPPRRRLTLTWDAPPGAPPGTGPTKGVLELGARTSDGCYVRRTAPTVSPVYRLGLDSCEAIDTHLATRELLEGGRRAELEDVTALAIGSTRFVRRGAGWLREEGATPAPASPAEAAALDALLEAVREAPEVTGYGTLRPRARLVITFARNTATLLFAAPDYALEGRAVRYRIPPEACTAWPTLCR